MAAVRKALLRYLRRLVNPSGTDEATDAALLGRFIARRDEEAFAALVVRHGPLEELSGRELLTIIDEELQRLPERYRMPVILCCLEGRSLDEAARQLGWTQGSVKGRLERGRARLHHRLVRRGLTFAAALAV